MKAHPSYTPAIGEDCRIVAPVPPPPGTPKPVLSGTAQTDYAVRLTFAMAGHDQIEIYSKRGNETVWTLLTVDTINPYTDGRAPLVANTPEVRQYRARYRDDDQPVVEDPADEGGKRSRERLVRHRHHHRPSLT